MFYVPSTKIIKRQHPHLLSSANDVKLGFYTVPTEKPTPGRCVAVHYTTAAPPKLHHKLLHASKILLNVSGSNKRKTGTEELVEIEREAGAAAGEAGGGSRKSAHQQADPGHHAAAPGSSVPEGIFYLTSYRNVIM